MILRPDGLLMSQFRRQFTHVAGFLVFRRHGRGEAYRITPDQQEEWTERFAKRIRLIGLISGSATVASLACYFALELVFFAPSRATSAISGLTMIIPVAPVLLFMTIENGRAIQEPLADLQLNVPIAPELSNDEWRREHLRDLSWGMLAIAPGFGAFVFWSFSRDVDVWRGWGRILWAIPIAFTALSLVQAVRKHRLDREA